MIGCGFRVSEIAVDDEVGPQDVAPAVGHTVDVSMRSTRASAGAGDGTASVLAEHRWISNRVLPAADASIVVQLRIPPQRTPASHSVATHLTHAHALTIV